ncbi:MAG: T9SS C-terminal target domain-containing protein [Crocinitomicaceae bacterium]|nr:T9SS C-terminal target domain-containing protein [Crocinitomicaceae bacterium]
MKHLLLIFTFTFVSFLSSQVVINEGCNKNYSAHLDENYEATDWIELLNNSNQPFNLANHFLTDNLSLPEKWAFPALTLEPNEHRVIFCSGKNRYGSPPFHFGVSQQNFTPVVGINTHNIAPFNWDGVSNLLINVCAYNNTQYTLNSIFKQTATTYPSTIASFIDGSPAACSSSGGQLYYQRPNLIINGIALDTGNIQNGNTDYPAPYGNYYWGSRHQILMRASELLSVGIQAGSIYSIGFDVVTPSSDFYNYVDISIIATPENEIKNEFLPDSGFQLHTNFKINSPNETVYLLDSNHTVVSYLNVLSPKTDISVGRYLDASEQIKWMQPTPNASNNSAITYTDTLKAPIFSQGSSVLSDSIILTIENPNTVSSKIVFTLDGSTPEFNSPTFNTPIVVSKNEFIRAQAYPLTDNSYLPSENTVATYLFNVSHTTPIILVTTDNSNLYGTNGIFDNPNSDVMKQAYVSYLSEEDGHPKLFDRKAAIRMDGGAGGSRSQPQRSFRLSFNQSALGSGTVNQALIPSRPDRTSYSDIYLRNGSNQYLKLPYKDACQVYMMSQGTKNYYSGYRPASVYINGKYFGLYELREKFNKEYFEVYNSNPIKDSIEILSLSYFYGSVLRALDGSTDNFWDSYDQFLDLSPTNNSFYKEADKFFDLKYYTDYIIGQSWMGNIDWPQNNIKIYRSDETNYRWRFCLIDLELALQPNGWTSCTDNHIRYMMDQSSSNPYINIWKVAIENSEYKNYFLNRFADLMNTSFQTDKLIDIEQQFYEGMLPEMFKEFARWGDTNNISGQIQEYANNHLTFQSQLACRNTVVRNNLVSEFNIEKKVNVILDVFPNNTGEIKINSIKSPVYPWTGIYFDGVPVTITASPQTGFMFSNWEPNEFITDTLNPAFEGNVSMTNTIFKAIFKKIPDGPDIHFTLYPSPTSSQLQIKHDNETVAKQCSFEIFDLDGRILKNGVLSPTDFTTIIDVSNFKASMYLVKILKFGEMIDVIKFVKN